MLTFLYSALHFLEDGLCAAAMFSVFMRRPDRALAVLLYNFCAFALQALFGAGMDCLSAGSEKKRLTGPVRSALLAGLGFLITFAGVFSGPVLLGIGNALFHVGGGMGTISEDRRKARGGRALGVFVAPGAMGLYLGTVLGKSALSGKYVLWCSLIFAAAAGLLALLFRAARQTEALPPEISGSGGTSVSRGALYGVLAVLLCFIVVMIRSHAGMRIGFSWKKGFTAGLVCTAAVVSGKIAGGFLNARFGTVKTVTVTLLLSALFYAFCEIPVCGVLALFLFNMTMPVTLYLITEAYKDLSGTMFGLLTLALFLGFLPTNFGLKSALSGSLAGVIFCLFSAVLLVLSAVLLKRRGNGEER